MATSGTPNKILCLTEVELDCFNENEDKSFVCFIKSFGNKTDISIHLTPFYNFVFDKINFSINAELYPKDESILSQLWGIMKYEGIIFHIKSLRVHIKSMIIHMI